MNDQPVPTPLSASQIIRLESLRSEEAPKKSTTIDLVTFHSGGPTFSSLMSWGAFPLSVTNR